MRNKENILHIIGIKTNKGYYITDNINNDGYYYTSSLQNYFINSEKPASTFKKDWFFIKDKPTIIEVMKSQPDINHRYELIDKSLASEKIPLVLTQKEATYYDEDDDLVWKEQYEHLSSLYKYKCDKQPNIKVKINFDFKIVMTLHIDEITKPISISYPVQKTQWASDGTTDITNGDIQHQLIDKIMFPSLLIHETPCKLSSEQVYKILRQYIKQHINYDVAVITSDYDFCFTVKKRIALDDPYTESKEILKSNGRSYKKPRYHKRYVSTRLVEIFEMTYSPENYEGYTPISGIVANNEEELKGKIDKLCKETIDMINEPLKDCPYCHGMGVIFNEDIKNK